MKNIITSILMLVSILGFSQERYDLFLVKDKNSNFISKNELDRACQIYYFQKIDSTSFVFYNHYLRFEFVSDSQNVSVSESIELTGNCKMSFQGENEGAYKVSLHQQRGHWYIIKFQQSETDWHYYYFQRRWEFLEKYWPENSREIIPVSSIPTTIGDSE